MSRKTVYICPNPKCGAILKLHGGEVQCQECYQLVTPKPVPYTVWHGIAEAIEKQRQKREEEEGEEC